MGREWYGGLDGVGYYEDDVEEDEVCVEVLKT